MTQNLKLPICPRCNETRDTRPAQTTKSLSYSNTFECTYCNIQWNAGGIIQKNRKLNEYEINEILKDYGFVDFQMALCQQYGFVYGAIYLLGYTDPDYPCDCICHRPEKGQTIRHLVACCWDKSFPPTPSRLFGVYNGRRGPYLLFNTGKHEYQINVKDRSGWSIT